MVGMSDKDWLENTYRYKFADVLSAAGVVIHYDADRAGIDGALHLFVEDEKTGKTGKLEKFRRATFSRVWFQLKGKRSDQLTPEQFAAADSVAIPVEVDHLKFWYASPESVYLVGYVESVNTFLALDVRELVDQRWGEHFYQEMELLEQRGQTTVTVHLPTGSLLDTDRVATLVKHRSMRIDGPAFRGRPLGHRLDPLRSTIAVPDAVTWRGLVDGVLAAHDFEESAQSTAGDLTLLIGTMHQTLLWQSPAFSEYGWDSHSRFRTEASPEQLFGPVCLLLDHQRDRTSFNPAERQLIDRATDQQAVNGLQYGLFFRGRDLSGHGGTWRATLSHSLAQRQGGWSQLGLEALTYLVLVSTLVYLEYAPLLRWENANYLP